jgi:hypothetical protein
MIGRKVRKTSISNNKNQPKKFKSGNRYNTVSGIINHPQLNVPAFTFIEDDSYVACFQCYEELM